MPWFGLAVGILAWCVAIRASSVLPDSLRHQLPSTAGNVASGLFMIAGVLRLARWRLTGDAESARSALALLTLGTALPAAALIGPLMHEPAVMAQSAPTARALFLVPVFALLLPGPRWKQPDRAIPRRFPLLAGTIAAVLMVTELLLGHQNSAAVLPSAWVSIESTATTCWLVLAIRVWRSADDRQVTRRWVAAGLALLAGTEVFRAWTVMGTVATLGIAPGLQLAAAVLGVSASTADLRETYRRDTTQSAQITRALLELRSRLERIEQSQRERLHDARSAIVGVMGASELLARPATTAIDPDLLRRLIAAELQRLQAVLDSDAVESIEEFDLLDALEPVVMIHRLDGRTITTRLRSLPVIGRPRATATVLDNLLRNASVHAPGAQIAIRAERCGPVATVVIEDDGPGIPATECEQVLQRGVRGSSASSPGSGLGLFSAAKAMREQDGTLELSGGAGRGTRVVLTLPIAPARVGGCALAS